MRFRAGGATSLGPSGDPLGAGPPLFFVKMKRKGEDMDEERGMRSRKRRTRRWQEEEEEEYWGEEGDDDDDNDDD